VALQLSTFLLQAMSAVSAIVESKMSKELKKFLKKNVVKAELTDELAVAGALLVSHLSHFAPLYDFRVADSKLGGAIKDKLAIQVCVIYMLSLVLHRIG
jgi:hypothetical protein